MYDIFLNVSSYLVVLSFSMYEFLIFIKRWQCQLLYENQNISLWLNLKNNLLHLGFDSMKIFKRNVDLS